MYLGENRLWVPLLPSTQEKHTEILSQAIRWMIFILWKHERKCQLISLCSFVYLFVIIENHLIEFTLKCETLTLWKGAGISNFSVNRRYIHQLTNIVFFNILFCYCFASPCRRQPLTPTLQHQNSFDRSIYSQTYIIVYSIHCILRQPGLSDHSQTSYREIFVVFTYFFSIVNQY